MTSEKESEGGDADKIFLKGGGRGKGHEHSERCIVVADRGGLPSFTRRKEKEKGKQKYVGECRFPLVYMKIGSKADEGFAEATRIRGTKEKIKFFPASSKKSSGSLSGSAYAIFP